jgi:hypothetical protein
MDPRSFTSPRNIYSPPFTLIKSIGNLQYNSHHSRGIFPNAPHDIDRLFEEKYEMAQKGEFEKIALCLIGTIL